jgi:hypothetical protein
LDFVPSALTVFAVLLPILDFDLASPVVIELAALCICSWMLIAVDLRRRTTPKHEQVRERVRERA